MSFDTWTPVDSGYITGAEESAAVVWPYCTAESIESLEWRTDILGSKSQEQRIAMRAIPRRVFSYQTVLTDYELTGAKALIRRAQAGAGFLVPDWQMGVRVGPVTAGSAETVFHDLGLYQYGSQALLWESPEKYDVVYIDRGSAGESVLDPVTNDYSDAMLLPLWPGHCLPGVSAEKIGANYNSISVEFVVTAGDDIGASDYPQYRGLDVMDDCPVLVGGLSESISWDATTLDNGQSDLARLRQKDYPANALDMRWHVFGADSIWTLRRWLYSRRGRQRAFWLPSYSQDFEPAYNVVGNNLFVYAPPGSTNTGHLSGFDIQILAHDGTEYHRRVNGVYDGPMNNGRNTLALVMDSPIDSDDGFPLADIRRVSYMHCVRFDADRIELLAAPKAGVRVRVPCVEVPEP